MLFSFVQVFGYLGTLENSQKILKKSAFPKLRVGQRGATGQLGGTQKGPWRGPALGHAGHPLGWVPHPLVPYSRPIFTPHEETPEQKSNFRSMSRSRRNP